jgi:hypothetical protein
MVEEPSHLLMRRLGLDAYAYAASVAQAGMFLIQALLTT